jgi:redox-sensing transcriptional repressor
LALLRHEGFRRYGFRFVAAFDKDPAKIGKRYGDVVVSQPSDFRRVLRGARTDIGIITVPAASAQQAAYFFACLGVRAILNMAPVKLGPIGNVTVSNLDLALELEKLSCGLALAMCSSARPLEERPA